MRILLITPPMTQINTPYPATAYLTSYLRSKGYECQQRDMSLDFALKIFSKNGLTRIHTELNAKATSSKNKLKNDSVQFFQEAFDDYVCTIDPVIGYLQGRDPSLALRIAERKLVPDGPRFLNLAEHPELLEKFGEMGLQDRAKYIASLYIDDLSDMITAGIDSEFGLSRYAEQLAESQASFSPLYKKLNHSPTVLDQFIHELTVEYFNSVKPDIVGFTLPFPGNVYAALRSAREFKILNTKIKIFAGGGYVNTELRDLTDPRIFEFIDALTYDDGERPLECLLEFFNKKRDETELFRTKILKNKKVMRISSLKEKDPPFKLSSAPTYEGLNLKNYVSMLELPNPVHQLWSDFRWNKMILAHGCYWKKCTFCDVHLDYIGRFETQSASQVVDQIEKLMNETGQSGFHFVDEAAPPALLKAMSLEIIKRKLKITFWGNIRFDKQFTKEVCELLADAGCVAVTGGLEVASPRILNLINKGVTVDLVSEITSNFVAAGIYVHAYLMYGFPTQTKSETIESLENVRNLFLKDSIHSAHWHRFVCTAHSPIGRDPEKFGIQLERTQPPKEGLFAEYAIEYTDKVKTNHDELGLGLQKALYNYMHGVGLERSAKSWFT
ncbi:MAG: radical SAM protein [Bdellovibrionales bacterium]|nr:radical SAM protein [Bdellovibrionales bacterium]